MGRSDVKPNPPGLNDAGNFTPSSQPPDKDVKSTSQEAGLAGKFGAFKGGARSIQRARMSKPPKNFKDETRGY